MEIANKDYSQTFHVYTYKLILCYFFDDYTQAVENAKLAEKYIESAVGNLMDITQNSFM